MYIGITDATCLLHCPSLITAHFQCFIFFSSAGIKRLKVKDAACQTPSGTLALVFYSLLTLDFLRSSSASEPVSAYISLCRMKTP